MEQEHPAPGEAERPLPTGDTLNDWKGWWAVGRCSCTASNIPMQMLIRAHGGGHRVRDVLARMRCRNRCRERPVFDGLVDRAGDPRYGAAVRRVPVP